MEPVEQYVDVHGKLSAPFPPTRHQRVRSAESPLSPVSPPVPAKIPLTRRPVSRSGQSDGYSTSQAFESPQYSPNLFGRRSYESIKSSDIAVNMPGEMDYQRPVQPPYPLDDQFDLLAAPIPPKHQSFPDTDSFDDSIGQGSPSGSSTYRNSLHEYDILDDAFEIPTYIPFDHPLPPIPSKIPLSPYSSTSSPWYSPSLDEHWTYTDSPYLSDIFKRQNLHVLPPVPPPHIITPVATSTASSPSISGLSESQLHRYRNISGSSFEQKSFFDSPKFSHDSFFPSDLTSTSFGSCKYPWLLSDVFQWCIFQIRIPSEQSLSEARLVDSLQCLFRYHVPSLSISKAEALGYSVITSFVESKALTATKASPPCYLWDTRAEVSGVLPELTCYSKSCNNFSVKCYSPVCSRRQRSFKHRDIAEQWVAFNALQAQSLVSNRESKKQNAIHQFIELEKQYVDDLILMQDLHCKGLQQSAETESPVISPLRMTKLISLAFASAVPVLQASTKLISALLILPRQETFIGGIGETLLEWCREATTVRQAYVQFASNLPYAEQVIKDEIHKNVLFRNFLQKCQDDPRTRRLDFSSFLQLPTRRLQRYAVHMVELMSVYDDSDSEKGLLVRAESQIRSILVECDFCVHQSTSRLELLDLDEKIVSKDGKRVDLQLTDPSRQILIRCDLERRSDHNFEWLIVHVFLFDNYFVMTKTRKDRTRKYYISKRPIRLESFVLETMNEPVLTKSNTGLLGTFTSSRLSTEQSPIEKLDRLAVPTATIIAPDDNTIYPFTITNLAGGDGDTITLFADSASKRKYLTDKILEAQKNLALASQKTEIYRGKIIARPVFGIHVALDAASYQKCCPPVVQHSFLQRALLNTDNMAVEKVRLYSRITCLTRFKVISSSTEPTNLIAIGTNDGVWIASADSEATELGKLERVLKIHAVTQIDVLEDFGIFLVLADKSLIAYPLQFMIPHSSGAMEDLRPQKLSGKVDVDFFTIGRLTSRTVIIYKRRDPVGHSVFVALEPVIGQLASNRSRLGLGRRGFTEFFREYDKYTLSIDCHTAFCFSLSLVVASARGFEVIATDSGRQALALFPILPEKHALLQRIRHARPIGIHQLRDSSLLLCYTEFALLVDKYGVPITSKVIYWQGKPMASHVSGKHIIAVSPKAVEIWAFADEVKLLQIIPGRDIRLIGSDQTSIFMALNHPERLDLQAILHLEPL